MFNDNNYLVSVIAPIYNVENYVSKCIQSICDQSYQNIEIILVDDESTDSSGRIADEFSERDNRITVIHKENGGVSSARNAGIEAAKGDYVCFIDGDDFVASDYVEYMLNIALKYDAQLAIVPMVLGTFNQKQEQHYEDYEISSEKALEKLLCYRIREGCYSKLFRKDLLEKNLRFSNKLVMGEGFTFNSIAIQKADTLAIGTKKVYYYRRDNIASATSKFNKSRFENGLYALDVIRDNIKYRTPEVMKAWEYAYWRTHTDVYDAIVLAHSETECKELYEKCKKITRKNALVALSVPIKTQDKIRAMVMWICPKAIPLMMKIRKRIYRIGGVIRNKFARADLILIRGFQGVNTANARIAVSI